MFLLSIINAHATTGWVTPGTPELHPSGLRLHVNVHKYGIERTKGNSKWRAVHVNVYKYGTEKLKETVNDGYMPWTE